MGNKYRIPILLLVCGLVHIIYVQSFAQWMTNDFCHRNIKIGEIIMNQPVVDSTEYSIAVYRGEIKLAIGDDYISGETLTVVIEGPESKKPQFVIEATGGAKFEHGGCEGRRISDKKKAFLDMPVAAAAKASVSKDVEIYAAWSSGHEQVKMSAVFQLHALREITSRDELHSRKSNKGGSKSSSSKKSDESDNKDKAATAPSGVDLDAKKASSNKAEAAAAAAGGTIHIRSGDRDSQHRHRKGAGMVAQGEQLVMSDKKTNEDEEEDHHQPRYHLQHLHEHKPDEGDSQTWTDPSEGDAAAEGENNLSKGEREVAGGHSHSHDQKIKTPTKRDSSKKDGDKSLHYKKKRAKKTVKSNKFPSSLATGRTSLRGTSISVYIEDAIIAYALWVVFIIVGLYLAYRVFLGRFKISRYFRKMRGFEVDK